MRRAMWRIGARGRSARSVLPGFNSQDLCARTTLAHLERSLSLSLQTVVQCNLLTPSPPPHNNLHSPPSPTWTMDIASQPRPHILIPHIYDRPHSPPSLTHTSGSSDHSDDAAARTYLMTPQSANTRDYGDVYDPRGRAPLIPKTGDDLIYPDPKTPTRSGYPIRDMASPVSAPATPVGKEKRKSKRFTLSFGRDRAPPPPVPDVPPLPTLEKLETEKRKSKRLSISRSLQNLKERAQADKARRRASSLSGS